jgi:hypothetical protein
MSNSSLVRSFTLPLFLAGLAANAQAQFADVRWHGDTMWDETFEAPEEPGTFWRSQAGDFDRNDAKDVFVLSGGQLIFMYSPASWDALRLEGGLSSTINDIAAIPAPDAPTAVQAPYGDLLVYVDAVGLACVYPVFTNGVVTGFAATAMSATGSVWANAVRLRTGDVDANGDVDCIGIKSESGPPPNQTILVRRTQAGVGHTTSFSVGATAYDLKVLQWDSDAQLEIAVLTTAGVKVYDYNGTLLNTHANNASTTTDTDAIAVFRTQGYAYDRLAWARRRPAPNSSEQELVELAGASVYPTGIYFSATDRATAMVAGDVPTSTSGGYVLDGNDELMVAHEAHQNPKLFRGSDNDIEDPESFSENTADQQYLSDTEVGGLNEPMWIGGYTGMPAPIFEDLSGDGVTDIFLPVLNEEASWFQVWRGEPIAPPPSLPLTGAPVTRLELGTCSVPFGGGTVNGQTAPNITALNYATLLVPATGEMTIELNVPYVTQPVVPNRLEIMVWRRKIGFLTVAQPYTEYARVTFPLWTDSDADGQFDDAWTGTGILRARVPMHFLLNSSPATSYLACQYDSQVSSQVNFWLAIRLIEWNQTPDPDTYRKVGEEYVVGFAASAAEGTNLDQNDPDFEQVCVENFPACNNQTAPSCPEGGVVISGSNSRRRRLPPSANKLPPNPPSEVINLP